MKNADMPAMPITDECGMPFNDVPAGLSTIGLTKREEFAARAMEALIPIYWDTETLHDYGTSQELIKCMMETAIEHADALLKELDK